MIADEYACTSKAGKPETKDSASQRSPVTESDVLVFKNISNGRAIFRSKNPQSRSEELSRAYLCASLVEGGPSRRHHERQNRLANRKRPGGPTITIFFRRPFDWFILQPHISIVWLNPVPTSCRQKKPPRYSSASAFVNPTTGCSAANGWARGALSRACHPLTGRF